MSWNVVLFTAIVGAAAAFYLLKQTGTNQTHENCEDQAEDRGVEYVGDSDVRFVPNDEQPEDLEMDENEEDSNDDDAGRQFDNGDRARRALEERQEGQVAGRVNAWKQKGTVGTKKAKSLARRDQRRAYYEYIRQQAEEKRLRLQIEEEQFGDLQAEEREQRELRIEDAKQKLEDANKVRREKEEEERKERRERRKYIERNLATGKAELKSDLDVEIAEDISGALVLESAKHAIAIDPLAKRVADVLATEGRMSIADVQKVLS